MDLSVLIKQGLLGYQPIFFPNGVISGAGFQFFGNLRNMRSADTAVATAPSPDRQQLQFRARDSFNFNEGRLGNLYVPPGVGERSAFDSEFYYCVEPRHLFHFARYNLLLLEMYRHFATSTMAIAASRGVEIESMIEVGSNTCVFPLLFHEQGVADCHGTDIVDYSPVVDLLASLRDAKIGFHHMADDSEATWKRLPSKDLVWSYAVVLHQSNPLAHLTRLASLGKKAMFVMTLCEPEGWKSPSDMGIRYLSANSYYNADFPNCFDVSIVSPELVRYSLKRLGFDEIHEIPRPTFESLDPTTQGDLDYWMKKHCFLLALRDKPRDSSVLGDYSVDTERSPYKGDNVLVHTGYHHNVVLSQSRYHVVPHGRSFSGTASDVASFSSLNNAMKHLLALPDELRPYPVRIRSLAGYNVIRFKNTFYLCPHGVDVDFSRPEDLSALHALDALEKWDSLIAAVGESAITGVKGTICEFIEGYCIVKTSDGRYSVAPVSRAESDSPTSPSSEPTGKLRNKVLSLVGLGKPSQAIDQRSSAPAWDTLPEAIRALRVRSLLASMNAANDEEQALYRADDGWTLTRAGSGLFRVHAPDGAVVSEHGALEEAWKRVLDPQI